MRMDWLSRELKKSTDAAMKKQTREYFSIFNKSANIVIWTVDTDIIIALGSLHLLGDGNQILIETGVVKKNMLKIYQHYPNS